MLEAKNNLSKICNSLIENKEDYVVICKDGKPVAKIGPYIKSANRKFGILKGKHNFLMKITKRFQIFLW